MPERKVAGSGKPKPEVYGPWLLAELVEAVRLQATSRYEPNQSYNEGRASGLVWGLYSLGGIDIDGVEMWLGMSRWLRARATEERLVAAKGGVACSA